MKEFSIEVSFQNTSNY